MGRGIDHLIDFCLTSCLMVGVGGMEAGDEKRGGG